MKANTLTTLGTFFCFVPINLTEHDLLIQLIRFHWSNMCAISITADSFDLVGNGAFCISFIELK